MRSAALAIVVMAGCYEAAGSGGRGEEALGVGEPGEVHTLASSGEAGHVAFEGEGPGVAGDRVSFAGDVDGDGYDDVIITDHSYRAAGDPSARGAVYLVYGRQTWDASEPLLDAAAILECDDLASNDELYVAGAGDVDGDGYDDFLVGDWNDTYCGTGPLPTVTVVYGGATRIAGVRRLAELGTTITDPGACSGFGFGVQALGDIDGDGRGDFAAGTLDDLELRGTGRLLVFYGRADRWGGAATVADADARLTPAMPDTSYFGLFTAPAGDVDADGIDDWLAGDPSETGSGMVHLVRGSAIRLAGDLAVGTMATATFVASGGAITNGQFSAGLGDLDADGHSDILISGTDSDSVAGYLFYGSATLAGTIALTSADATLDGMSSPHGGMSISAAGDVDSDGRADFVVGDQSWSEGVGRAFVAFGPPTRLAGTVDLATISVIFNGGTMPGASHEVRDNAGESVAGGGDVDGNGSSDVLVGAPDSFGGDLETGGRVFLLRGAAD